MELETLREGGVTTVRIAGELDSPDKARVTAHLDELLRGGETRFLFDVERLSYMGSTGVGCLLRTRREALKNGGAVALLRPSPFLRKILGTLGLQGDFPAFDSREEALRALAAAPPPEPKPGEGSGARV